MHVSIDSLDRSITPCMHTHRASSARQQPNPRVVHPPRMHRHRPWQGIFPFILRLHPSLFFPMQRPVTSKFNHPTREKFVCSHRNCSFAMSMGCVTSLHSLSNISCGSANHESTHSLFLVALVAMATRSGVHGEVTKMDGHCVLARLPLLSTLCVIGGRAVCNLGHWFVITHSIPRMHTCPFVRLFKVPRLV